MTTNDDAEDREDGSALAKVTRERDAAQDAQDRFAFLARSGRLLAESIEYEETLKTVASLALPYLGAWCIVDVVEDGRLRRLTVIHPDTEKQELARRVCTRYPDRTSEALGVDRVLETGRPEVVSHVDPERLVAMAERGEALHLFEDLGVSGYMTVPMNARGETLGTMTFVVRENGRRIGEPDLLLAEDLANRAGLAIDNARLYRRSEEANRAKADFLSVISHELRTPLTAIQGFADLLAMGVDGPVNEVQKERLDRIHHSTDHMVQLVDELLTYAQVEAGRETVSFDEVEVSTELERALDAVRREATDKGLELRGDVEVSGPFRTDPRMLRQIAINLITNAVKYTNEGHVKVRVRLDGDAMLVLSVEDTGVGISEEDQEQVFAPFWQAEHPNTRTYGGTGIGLSLTRRLVQALGGGLELDSTLGEGSRFTVRIPAGGDD